MGFNSEFKGLMNTAVKPTSHVIPYLINFRWVYIQSALTLFTKVKHNKMITSENCPIRNKPVLYQL